MLVKVKYFGYYPLGSDIKINDIEIMKSRWNIYKKPSITYGKKNTASPFLQDLYYVVSKEKALEIIEGSPMTVGDFDTEFLDYILAVGIVDSVEDAVNHISAHSTQHSEAIITENQTAAEYFTENVDSAAIYVNASTRFTDGGEFGLGCEMGISTQKMHARGPLGIEELTTYKYIIRGNGQIR